MLDGHSSAHIKEAIASQFPNADLSFLQTTLDEHFVAASEQSTKVLNGWCREALREMYRRSVAVGDYAASMKAIAQLHKLVNESNDLDIT